MYQPCGIRHTQPATVTTVNTTAKVASGRIRFAENMIAKILTANVTTRADTKKMRVGVNAASFLRSVASNVQRSQNLMTVQTATRRSGTGLQYS